jgi:hypothetical protein
VVVPDGPGERDGDPVDPLMEIRRLGEIHRRGVICDAELANAFFAAVLEADPSAVESCLAEIPRPIHGMIGSMLREFAGRGHFDDRHAFISDGKTPEARRADLLRRQPHYRRVCEALLPHLVETPG